MKIYQIHEKYYEKDRMSLDERQKWHDFTLPRTDIKLVQEDFLKRNSFDYTKAKDNQFLKPRTEITIAEVEGDNVKDILYVYNIYDIEEKEMQQIKDFLNTERDNDYAKEVQVEKLLTEKTKEFFKENIAMVNKEYDELKDRSEYRFFPDYYATALKQYETIKRYDEDFAKENEHKVEEAADKIDKILNKEFKNSSCEKFSEFKKDKFRMFQNSLSQSSLYEKHEQFLEQFEKKHER